MNSLSFRPRRRRLRHGVMLALGLGAAVALTVAAAAVKALMHDDGMPSGVDDHIVYRPLSELPPWAVDALKDTIPSERHQYVAAVVDLNRDRQAEILLAAAPPRDDVFVPDLPLTVMIHDQRRWNGIDTGVRCRPDRFGGFMTGGYWDLRCRDAEGPKLLRWTGGSYSIY